MSEQVLTPIQGLKVFSEGKYRSTDGILVTKNQSIIELYFEDESFLYCTPDHKIKTKSGWKTAKELKRYDKVLDANDNELMLIYKEKSHKKQDVYDLVNVEETHSYTANNVKISNCLVCDEYAYVPNNIAESFYSSVYPTISSGKTSKMIIISTPKGLNHFYKMWVDATNKKSSYVPVEAFWYDVPGRDKKFKEETIANTSEQQWKVEFEGEFIGSENTLISASKIASLVFQTPIHTTTEGLDLYEWPIKDHVYTICVDTARGEGGDYHAFIIVDCSSFPYKMVGKFRNNTLSHQVFPSHIKKMGDLYNEAYVLFELNDLGQPAAEVLHGDLEYANIIQISSRSKRGQRADGGFGNAGGVQLGIKVSHPIKQVGATVMRDLIEDEKLVIPDYDTIAEMSTYVSKGVGYEATEGYNDDLMSCLIIFGWLTTQPYFKDYTNSDIRKRLYEEQIRKIEDRLVPFGFISNGLEEEDDGIDVFDERSSIQRKNEELDSWGLLDDR